MTREQYQTYESAVAAFIAREQLSFLSTTCEMDDQPGDGAVTAEPWFSWRSCDCCGTKDGGMREYLIARTAANDLGDEWVNPIVRFIICEDCVYYVNYGRLDDATMAGLDS